MKFQNPRSEPEDVPDPEERLKENADSR